MNAASISTVDTPNGPFSVIVTADETVLASGWTTQLGELLRQVTPTMRPTKIHEHRDLGTTTKAVKAYYQGHVHAIDDIPVQQPASQFLEHARHILRTVPPGNPVSYAEFAALAGNPRAVRAAASACARNAAALFVPCHRVVRTDGGLGGFAWGLPIKQWLLDHEQRNTMKT